MSNEQRMTSIPPEILEAVRRIEIRTRRLVQEVFSGEYHSVFKGTGMEFREVREYVPGDDVRTIDWNVTARTDEPFVKLFEEERELTVILAVDMSRSGLFGSQLKMKVDIATELCGVLAFSAIANKDKVGLVMFSDQVEKYIPPAKGKSHVLRLIRELLTFTPEGQGTDFNEPLKLLGSVLKRKSTIFLVSDFWTAGYSALLSILGRKHDVVAVRVRDPKETELSDAGLVPWIDAETGEEVLLDTSSPQVREFVRQQARKSTSKWRNCWPARVWTWWRWIAQHPTWSLCASFSWSGKAANGVGAADEHDAGHHQASGPADPHAGCRPGTGPSRRASCGRAGSGFASAATRRSGHGLGGVVFPEQWPLPAAVELHADTLFIGMPAELRLAFQPEALARRLPAGAVADSLAELGFDQPWFHWDRERQAATVQGDTLVIPVAVYQINPFRLTAGPVATPVKLVGLRAEGMDETADIRDPRRWGWNYWQLLLMALGLTLLVVLAVWFWTARKVAAETLAQWQPPLPGWLDGSIELVSLLDRNLVQKGDGRLFLDVLAGICRRFLAVRFGVGAQEMTSAEIESACLARGFTRDQIIPFTAMLAEVDAVRFDPTPLSSRACLLLARRFAEGMAAVRIIPRFTPVPAADLLAGEKAWARIQADLVAAEIPRDEAEFAPGGSREGGA
jgi:hypothetical protein